MTGQGETIFGFVYNNLTPILLIAGMPIFVWLAIKSKKVSTFQFQISLFILIWIIGELADLLLDTQFIPLQIGLKIHLLSMAFFAAMLWIRFYLAVKFSRTMIESTEEA